MSIAFPALVLLILLVPGLIFHAAYNGRITKDWHIPLNFPSITARGLFALVYATVLHAGAVLFNELLLARWTGLHVQLDVVAYLLIGVRRDESALAYAVDALTAHPGALFIYFVALIAVALVMGYGLSRLVRAYHLDLRWPLLRYHNDWHYLLWGEVLCFSDAANPIEPESIAGTRVTAEVEIAGKAYLYTGLLYDYQFDRTGQLERLVLTYAYRRLIDDDLSEDEQREGDGDPTMDPRYYRLKGDYLVLFTRDIQTLNLLYFQVG